MRKYLIDGQEIEVIKETKQGFLIQNIVYVDDYYGEDYLDDSKTYFVKQVFDSPPELKYIKEVNELKEKLEELNIQKKELQSKIKELEEWHKNLIQKYGRFSELKNLDLFIQGKITHYVILSWEPKILTFEKALCSYDKKMPRLLTLFGDSEGNLEWRLNYYSDGSGGSQGVVPCTSFKEAKQEVQQYITTRTKEILENKKCCLNYSLIDVAKKYKLKINKEYVKQCKKEKKERIKQKIKEAQEDLKKAKENLKSLTEEP